MDDFTLFVNKMSDVFISKLQCERAKTYDKNEVRLYFSHLNWYYAISPEQMLHYFEEYQRISDDYKENEIKLLTNYIIGNMTDKLLKDFLYKPF